MATEDKQLELESVICGLPAEKLNKRAEHLKIPLINYTGKSRLTVAKLLRDTITEKVESHESSEDKMEFFAGLANFNYDKPLPLDGSAEDSAPTEPSKSLDETSPLENSGNSCGAQHTEPSNSCQIHVSTPGLVGLRKSSEKGKKANDNVPVDMNKLFRREFKIRGQIGAPGSEDKLSFISLIRQIESATTKGYNESEIIDVFIRAISPGMALRSYLESTPELTLARLRQILRSYFRESDATELHQQLASLSQPL